MTQIASPCIGVCKIDPSHKLCAGCGRTVDEIMDWASCSAAERDGIWAALPDRLDRLGVDCRRLSWTFDEIAGFVVASISSDAGTWVFGVVGAMGEFTSKPDESATANISGNTIVAATDGGMMRFNLDETVHALVFGARSIWNDEAPLVLAVQPGMSAPSVRNGLTYLGPDHSAIAAIDREAHLFDLGIGRSAARFCIRTSSTNLVAELRKLSGKSLSEVLSQLGSVLVEEAPARVIETALGRVEITSPIPKPSEVTHAGPHTHLLPRYLATGQDMPARMALPPSYRPGAIFYPGRHGRDHDGAE